MTPAASTSARETPRALYATVFEQPPLEFRLSSYVFRALSAAVSLEEEVTCCFCASVSASYAVRAASIAVLAES